MKKIELSNKEIRLIVAGLELRNRHNENIINDCKMYNAVTKSCKEEFDFINKLKDKLEIDDNDTLIDSSKQSIINTSVRLDRCDIDKIANKLVDRLSRI